MSKLIARRRLLSFLPAIAVPFGMPKLAFPGHREDTPLLLNAGDSLYHYRETLLEKVRADAYERSAKDELNAINACNAKIADLRDAVSQLQTHLRNHANLPALQQRFSTLERSLALAQGKHPDQENTEAMRSLPHATEALRSLMKEVLGACNDDPDGKIADLVERVYKQINTQNRAIENVDVYKEKWNNWIVKIADFHQKCGNEMDQAAIAVADGVRNKGDWQGRAQWALRAASTALQGIEETNMEMAKAAPDDGRALIHTYKEVTPQGITAIQALMKILDTTQKSLSQPVKTASLQVAYGGGETKADQGQVPSVSLSKTDVSLVSAVQALVRQPKYFSPGSTTQTINCIAVCWPVWIVYDSNSADDVRNRTDLIASALYFGLIWGTIRQYHDELTTKLESLYLSATQSLAA